MWRFICSDEHSGKVKSFMLDILCPLITESDSVSNELLDIILSNIVEPLKSQRKNAYKLARELLLKCSDTLEPYIQAVRLPQPLIRWNSSGEPDFFFASFRHAVLQSSSDPGQRGQETFYCHQSLRLDLRAVPRVLACVALRAAAARVQTEESGRTRAHGLCLFIGPHVLREGFAVGHPAPTTLESLPRKVLTSFLAQNFYWCFFIILYDVLRGSKVHVNNVFSGIVLLITEQFLDWELLLHYFKW